ncbi:capsular polysaccharide export protein [Ancylobacter aquaticus]|uniref:Capsular polysaccharide export protein n=1 Tax=Ancylobacter aquaticus TaxID=100 RepID=A0A4V2PK32_ANCAQ|nr:capsular biosynthesis protein [Ancylobacter aquaticus]TCK30836.1 capsular polysaccharide export protein [Ancylobacter aquaticus]
MREAALTPAGRPALGFTAGRTALPAPVSGAEKPGRAGRTDVAGAFAGRCFLFLQGPASPFAISLARALRRGGARIVKVHLCGGDTVFWRGPARLYRGRPDEWPAYVDALMAQEGVSDLVLFGDCRPYHAPAVRVGRGRGVRLHLLEEGYERPGWITCESYGVNAHSDLPRTPEAVLAAASRLSEPAPLAPLFEPFARRALWDIAWHAGHTALAPLFPRYRRHTLAHPARDYVGWVFRWLTTSPAGQRDRRAREAIADWAPYFLLPLQLEGDYQMRVHSRFRSVEEVASEVLASFARAAPNGARLVLKRHPYDTRLPATRTMVARLAGEYGLAGRVVFIEGGAIEPLVAMSAGVVLVNSTTAMLALREGRPLKVLGRATYDMPGLSHQGTLDAFWTEAEAPDPELFRAYRRVVVARTQVAGGFFAPDTIARAVEGLVARMAMEGAHPA